MNPPPLPVAPSPPKSSAVTAGLDSRGDWLRHFLDFRPGVHILRYCNDLRSRRHVHQSGPARSHAVAVELRVARHLRRNFLCCYLRGYVWSIWASSTESPATADSFCVAHPKNSAAKIFRKKLNVI